MGWPLIFISLLLKAKLCDSTLYLPPASSNYPHTSTPSSFIFCLAIIIWSDSSILLSLYILPSAVSLHRLIYVCLIFFPPFFCYFLSSPSEIKILQLQPERPPDDPQPVMYVQSYPYPLSSNKQEITLSTSRQAERSRRLQEAQRDVHVCNQVREGSYCIFRFRAHSPTYSGWEISNSCRNKSFL